MKALEPRIPNAWLAGCVVATVDVEGASLPPDVASISTPPRSISDVEFYSFFSIFIFLFLFFAPPRICFSLFSSLVVEMLDNLKVAKLIRS
jgi:hypothetical protein